MTDSLDLETKEQEYVIVYGNIRYKLNKQLWNLPFFKALIETGEYEFHLNLFENEFKMLNKFNCLELYSWTSPSILNSSYEILHYFTHDEALGKLYKLVYEKETSKIKERVEKIITDGKNYYWDRISKGGIVSEAFLDKNINNIIYEILPLNPHISDAFIEKHMDIIGTFISRNMKNRSKYIIDNYLNNVFNKHGNILSKYHLLELFENYILPIEFIEKYIDKLNKNINISFYRNNKQLKDDFYEKYKDILEWRYICLLDLSEAFFERNLEYINWSVFSSNRYISVGFFEKYISMLDWNSICRNESIPCSFFELYSHKLDWEVISENPNITVDFIKKYINRMNFAPLCRRNLPEEFFEEHFGLVSFSILCENVYISEAFLLRHKIRDRHWDILMYNKSISEKFIKDNITRLSDKNTWEYLIKFRSADLLIYCMTFINKVYKDETKKHFDSLPIKITEKLNFNKFTLISILHHVNAFTEDIIEECIFEYIILLKFNILPYKLINIINGTTIDFYEKYKGVISINIYDNISIKKEMDLVMKKGLYSFGEWRNNI
jgi:hypothetical protein